MSRVLVTEDGRVVRAVDVGVIRGQIQTNSLHPTLVQHYRATRNHRRERRIENDNNGLGSRAGGTETEVANVDQPGTAGTTIRIGRRGVRAGRDRDNVQTARNEDGCRIECVQFVDKTEHGHIERARILDPNAVAQGVARLCIGSGILARGQVHHALLHRDNRGDRGQRVGVFVIEHGDRTVGQNTGIGPCRAGSSRACGIGTEPLGRAGHVGQRRSGRGINIDLGLVG